jgi:hypothetical protein
MAESPTIRGAVTAWVCAVAPTVQLANRMAAKREGVFIKGLACCGAVNGTWVFPAGE